MSLLNVLAPGQTQVQPDENKPNNSLFDCLGADDADTHVGVCVDARTRCPLV